MSRHIYDLEKLMDSEFGMSAIKDAGLYNLIVQHRAKYTAIRGLDYKNHCPDTINFMPPAEVLAQWERDYGLMQQSMIYGKSLSFPELMKRLEELKQRFRNLNRLPS